jgi:hypothetical protein
MLQVEFEPMIHVFDWTKTFGVLYRAATVANWYKQLRYIRVICGLMPRDTKRTRTLIQ